MAEGGLSEPRRRSVQCASSKGLHRIAYLEWGDPRNRDVLVCVHGLLRSARDFEPLARELSSHFRIACPDLAGRGDSDRLPDAALYAAPQYMADMVKDHQKDLAEFQNEAKTGSDPDLKAWAAKTTEMIKKHLALAKQTQSKLK